MGKNYSHLGSLLKLFFSTLFMTVAASAMAQNTPENKNLSGHFVASDYVIDSSISSLNQDLRIRTLVLHYTAEDLDDSLAHLTLPEYQVSAHYLVPDGALASHVYGLVPEDARAWHAGISQWRGVNNLNFSSVGIEIVNLGFPAGEESLPLMQRHWYPYDDAQIDVVGQLARDVVKRYHLLPYQVVGHSDIAPGRKTDPGPKFPWKELAERYGVGAWPDQWMVYWQYFVHPFNGDIGSLQEKLGRYGYNVPRSGLLDAATTNVVQAFQMHFRPELYDGRPDRETVAILDALLWKYFPSSSVSTKMMAVPLSTDADRNEKGDGD